MPTRAWLPFFLGATDSQGVLGDYVRFLGGGFDHCPRTQVRRYPRGSRRPRQSSNALRNLSVQPSMDMLR
jgi:hypothetical protein